MTMKLIILFCLFSVVQGASVTKWEYSGVLGPKKWPEMGGNEACKGKQQSPVPLDENDAVFLQKLADAPLQYEGYNEPASTLQLVNNGHTVRVNVEGRVRISGALLPGEFQAVQFHFHWGSRAERGSEHTINNHRFPMEMHIVHYNTYYPDLATAVQHNNGTAVLAFMFDIVKGVNHNLEELVEGTWNVPYKGERTRLNTFPLDKILPPTMTDYFRYHGSLTTPPCYESVEWVVFPDPIAISENQINAFRSLNAAPRDSTKYGPGKSAHPVKIVNNFRPRQRKPTKVYRNFKLSVRHEAENKEAEGEKKEDGDEKKEKEKTKEKKDEKDKDKKKPGEKTKPTTAAKPTKKPGTKTAKKTTTSPAKKPTPKKPTTKPTTKKPTTKPSTKVAKKPTTKPAKKPTTKPVKKPTTKATSTAAKKSPTKTTKATAKATPKKTTPIKKPTPKTKPTVAKKVTAKPKKTVAKKAKKATVKSKKTEAKKVSTTKKAVTKAKTKVLRSKRIKML